MRQKTADIVNKCKLLVIFVQNWRIGGTTFGIPRKTSDCWKFTIFILASYGVTGWWKNCIIQFQVEMGVIKRNVKHDLSEMRRQNFLRSVCYIQTL